MLVKQIFINLSEKIQKVDFLISFVLLISLVLHYSAIDNSAIRSVAAAFSVFVFLFLQAPLFIWLIFFFILSFFYFQAEIISVNSFQAILNSILLTAGGIICFLLMRLCFSFLFFKAIIKKNFIPKISETEQEALLAGSSWIEKEFFKGRPDFKNLFHQPLPKLKQEEKNFLNKEVEELSSLSKEWELIKRKQLSKATESFLKKEKFFGLVIPQKYKGKGFSPFAHAKLIEKLAGHNIPLSIITMVPNSLGPAELLLKYGSTEQKDKYLPRLALGEELPCFGLTEDQAGSDASSIESEGVLFKEKDIIKVRLNWSKRWITLSAKATLIGLAVKLKDPERLYSNKEDLGITCLLVPGDSPGIERGLYHDPMGIPIYNAPIKGKDVIVPAEESIIGGLKNAGKGWKMLMESLSSGRGLSLPALAVGCAKKISWLAGAHTLVRRQFGLPIGKFEGVEEALAPIAGLTHLMSTVQTLTLSGLNQGVHSPVVTALTKYNLTETAQKITKKGMDIMGGAGLSLGPRNKIAHIYTSLPMAVTVEGANILTRTFIIYGQGLIKTHPYIYKIITALKQNSFKDFHSSFYQFFYQFISNFIRGISLSATRAWLCFTPKPFAKEHRHLQKISWISSLFSFLSDLNMIVFGGRLKTKGRLTGRLADLLSYQYMATALIWYWQKTGANKKSWTETKWGLEYCFSKIQETLEDTLKNYPHSLTRMTLIPLLYLLRLNPIACKPLDHLNKKIAKKLSEDEEFRKNLCSNMYFPKDPEDQFQKLNKAYQLSLKENKILQEIKKETRKKITMESALKQNIISPEEYKILKSAEQARKEAIQVDAFTAKEYFGF